MCRTDVLLGVVVEEVVQEEVMPTPETLLRQELRDCALELRQLAYTVPHGVGEHALLQLSDRMRTAADEVVRKGA
jgi:hypothetical protein